MNIQEDFPMRKQILATALVILIFCTSCAVQPTAIASDADEESIEAETSARAETSIEITEYTVLIEPIIIDDMYRFVEDTDIIIIGMVEEALPVVRIDASSLGLVSGDPGFFENISSYQVRIEQVIKGDVSADETIRIDMHGGTAEGVFENYIGMIFPVENSHYLFFIENKQFSDKTDYFEYRFGVTYDGFSEIVDGKLYPQENTSIFEAGTPIEEVIARITEAMEGPSPVESE